MKLKVLFFYLLAISISVALTTAIWLIIYFAAVAPVPPTPKKPIMPKCAETCEFVVCESIPRGLQFDPKYKIFNSTTDCWMRLMSEAKKEILIGSYYWSLLTHDADNYTNDKTNSSFNGRLIYTTLQDTANRGIDIRIAQNYDEDGVPETAALEKNSSGKIQVRTLRFPNWYPGGILHTKSWSVDGKHFYIGSANFDWRSLTQVKELGMAAFNCPCMGEDLKNLLEIYWEMGSPGAKIPKRWDDSYSTAANHNSAMTVPDVSGNQAMYISASPPGFRADGREDDLEAMIKEIDNAKDFLHLAVMDYSPSTLYLKDGNKWRPELDNAIRRAAFERCVDVKFMLSLWDHTYSDAYALMYSLQDTAYALKCSDKDGKKKGSIEVRFIKVPAMEYGDIPFARVYHNKYFVSESTAYIGTSNWSADYWEFTAGIGLIVRSDDVTQKSKLVADIQSIFERDWNSNYTIPLNNFDVSGNCTNVC